MQRRRVKRAAATNRGKSGSNPSRSEMHHTNKARRPCKRAESGASNPSGETKGARKAAETGWGQSGQLKEERGTRERGEKARGGAAREWNRERKGKTEKKGR